MHKEKGFTLIELMIVVAIIGVLAAIAIPMYQNYVAKSQLTVALAELEGAKTQYELIVSNGSASGSADYTVPNMFFAGLQSNLCIYAVNPPNATGDAAQALVCKLNHVAAILKNESLYLHRSASGTWSCTTSVGIDNKFKPTVCI